MDERQQLREYYRNVSEWLANLELKERLVGALVDEEIPGEFLPLSSKASSNPDALRGQLSALEEHLVSLEQEIAVLRQSVEASDPGLAGRVAKLQEELDSLQQPLQDSLEEQTRLSLYRTILERVEASFEAPQREKRQLEEQLAKQTENLKKIKEASPANQSLHLPIDDYKELQALLS